tara:strand:- start:181 stop:792 length:612 start_codon:yes stop_codon:yes gene_type:complete
MLSKDKIIYVRFLQLKFYKSDQALLKYFFEFENVIFNFCKNINENIMIQVKLKWLQNEIINENKNLPFFDLISNKNSQDIKKKLIELINIFSEILVEEKIDLILKKFKSFNIIFNEALNNKGKNEFKTSFFFQFCLFLYYHKSFRKQLQNQSLDYFNSIDKKKIDDFELVFIEIFLNSFTFENIKIKKLYFLQKLLIKFIFKK